MTVWKLFWKMLIARLLAEAAFRLGEKCYLVAMHKKEEESQIDDLLRKRRREVENR